MTSPEQQPSSPMRHLKDAKFALNAGRPVKAYQAATLALQQAHEQGIPRIEAMALHRIGSAQEDFGLHKEAERHLGLSLSILESLDTPDYLAQGIVERDIALLTAQRDKSPAGRSEAAHFHQSAMVSHEMAAKQLPKRSARVKLELATTAAFGHRLQALENRFQFTKLWDDATEIRELRGHTKPAYELHALDWATRYEPDTAKIVRALPRVAFLSMQVNNPALPARIYTRPTSRFLSNRLD